jgi:hypothetical protein
MSLKFLAWPCWYLYVALAWSAYQGFRGAVEQDWLNDYRARAKPPAKIAECWKRWVILYIHDFVFRFVCTMAGFESLYACYLISDSIKDWKELSAGIGALLAASFIVGVIGVGGQLHYVILLGKGAKIE